MLPTLQVIDFEGNRTYGILEYGLVTLQDNSIVDIHSASCVRKPMALTAHFLEHSRLTARPTDTDFGEHLPLFLRKRREGLFCAHGASVEDRLLRQYRLTPGVTGTFSEESGRATGVAWGPWIDTCKIYKRYYPSLERYGVGDLIRQFALQGRLEDVLAAHRVEAALTFHRALYDALATTVLLQHFIESFRVEHPCFLLPE
jgi:DNA polymerase III epsilon subunit-like protein